MLNNFRSLVLVSIFIFTSLIQAQYNVTEAEWLKGSWGVTFPVFGGERLDSEVNNGYQLRNGAQEVVNNLPTAGHVITNLSYFAHSHYFTLRNNNNVNVAREIHPSLVPSLENERIIFDVLKTFKDSGKRIILYISTNYMERASDEVKASWVNYYNRNFNGNEYLAYENLIQGYIERVKDYADGYWLDTTSDLNNDDRLDDFIRMIKRTDPGAAVSANRVKNYFEGRNGNSLEVDSDGLNDTDDTNYKIILHEPLNLYQDFTNGHITPLGQGAPPNSWAYEEFTIPNMVEEPVVNFQGKAVLKHGWFPIRARWHSPRTDMLFDNQQAYRFAKSITQAGASMTFANTIDFGIERPGHMMPDEMAVMKFVNDRLSRRNAPDYVPYSRPRGAFLVNENQVINPVVGSINDPGPSSSTSTPTSPTQNGSLVHITKRNARGFALDGGLGGANRQNVTLSVVNTADVGQLWVEIDRGNGFYTYEKFGTNYSLDGGSGGATNQSVYLWRTSATNQNQQWQKQALGDGGYKLIKRNARDFAINGGSGGVEGRDINLWSSASTNQNLQWYVTPVNAAEAIRLQAENFDSMSGVKTEASTESGDNVGYINNGDWLRFNDVNLSGITNMNVRVSSRFTGGTIEVRTGSTSGTLIGSVNVGNTGGNQNWRTLRTSINNASGSQDVYLVFTGGNGFLFNVNWIEFNTDARSNKEVAGVVNIASNVIIYPNPVLSKTTIENAANSDIIIYDMNGSVVLEIAISSESEIIDLSALTTGIYYAQIQGLTHSSVIKIIKN